MKDTVLVVWNEDKISGRYIYNLNKFLGKGKTQAMRNTKVMPELKERPRDMYRPMIVFNYDKSKPYQKCFSLSSPKPFKGKMDDSAIYFKLSNGDKVVLTNPIEVPTQYLNTIKFEKLKPEVENIKDDYSREKWQKYLEQTESEYNEIILRKDEILHKYGIIRNDSQQKEFKQQEVHQAWLRMIDEEKAHLFCLRECDRIKENKDWIKENEKRYYEVTDEEEDAFYGNSRNG